MMKMRRTNVVVATTAFIISLSMIASCNAGRPLHEEKNNWAMKKRNGGVVDLVIESLPRGPVPPSGPSGCTYIPGRGGPRCPLNGKKVAGAVTLNNHERRDSLSSKVVGFTGAKQQQRLIRITSSVGLRTVYS
ncbi:hypothetical protein Scep_029802 [Stephania cephalantha]|uniref:Uncharacterized protein n=1 Tax=Stephania cephalantha TaxID=152367 RepID=A0AAP0DYK4_9MAGN